MYDEGPGGPAGRPYYANPAAWVIGLLIVLLLILLLVFGLGRMGDNDGGAPVVRQPAPQAPANPGADTGGDAGDETGSQPQQEGGAGAEGSVEGGGTVGETGGR